MATLLAGGGAAHAQFTLLHTFTGNGTGTDNPVGSLTLSGSTLYGMTEGGYDNGTIFSLSTSGGSYTVLHSFTGSTSDGAHPYGSLTLSGSTLYGMTFSAGGPLYMGMVFQISTTGSGYTKLYSFTGPTSDGSYPEGSLTLSGSTLYGMTQWGGAAGNGTVFSLSTAGGSDTVLHSFTGGSSDGSQPYGSLTLSGSTLYGMTYTGGANGKGTVFSLSTAGGSDTVLHSFTGGSSDGSYPKGSLTLSGSTLYGMTYYGGANGQGTVFKMNTDGSGFTILHGFTGYPNDGANPVGSLTLSGSTLYGMTSSGGTNYDGMVFQMNTNGSGYTNLYSFTGGSDGGGPYDSLTFSGSTLYGMTQWGGANNSGTVFSLSVIPEPSTLGIMVLLGVGMFAWRRLSRWV